MARVACLMMQRDEEDLLEPWLAYHGYLFGFDNLYVIDNGSESSVVWDVIRRYAKAGVNFDFSFSDSKWYDKKGEITKNKINELQANGDHDIFFPMDCDEFLAIFGRNGLSCSRNEIGEFLSLQAAKKTILRAPVLLYNVPGAGNYFYMMNQFKIFIAMTKLCSLEHGNHGASLGSDDPVEDLPLTYLHFHNKPYRSIRKHALQKLSHRLDTSDTEAIKSYTGHGDHLVKYFTMSEEEYVRSFAHLDVVDFKEFGNLLDALGAGEGIRRVSWTDVVDIERSGHVISSELDAKTYLVFNRDVAYSGMPPLVHYYKFGRKESRRF